MTRPRALDLFCGAGGATRGLQAAGFHVTGVDINPQPRYCGDAFLQADAMNIGLGWFDFYWASPPCQHYTPLGALHPEIEYPDLVASVREMLRETCRPWVIENVMTAPLDRENSIVLCGGMFGLRTYRHRRFESSFPLIAPEHPTHVARTATKQRRARWAEGWHVSITGDVGVYVGPEAMGIDWMNGDELCQAIPPAYAAWIGRQAIRRVAMEKAA